MKYRHTSLVILLLLPLLLARGLLPAGFMLSFDSGRPELVYCPAQGQSIQGQSIPGPSMRDPSAHGPAVQTPIDVHAAHHHHHDPAGSDSSGRSAHDNTVCPFALAASMAPPAAVIRTTFTGVVTTSISHFPDQLFASRAPAHAHLIRGPPALS